MSAEIGVGASRGGTGESAQPRAQDGLFAAGKRGKVGFAGQSAPPDLLTRAAHESFLAETPRRRRGDVDVETAVAAAKLNDAQTSEDARAWLNSRERLAVLNDRALIVMLARLPNAAAQANAAAQPNAA